MLDRLFLVNNLFYNSAPGKQLQGTFSGLLTLFSLAFPDSGTSRQLLPEQLSRPVTLHYLAFRHK